MKILQLYDSNYILNLYPPFLFFLTFLDHFPTSCFFIIPTGLFCNDIVTFAFRLVALDLHKSANNLNLIN